MRAALFLAAAVLTGCRVSGEPARVDAPADTAAGEVGFTLMAPNDAAILVPVYINGAGPFDLVLDTGATFTCLASALADSLQLSDRPGVTGFGAGVQSAGRVRIVQLDSVRVGSATAHDLPGCALDLDALQTIGASVDGLLGLNFLRSFDVRLDFGRNAVTLTARD